MFAFVWLDCVSSSSSSACWVVGVVFHVICPHGACQKMRGWREYKFCGVGGWEGDTNSPGQTNLRGERKWPRSGFGQKFLGEISYGSVMYKFIVNFSGFVGGMREARFKKEFSPPFAPPSAVTKNENLARAIMMLNAAGIRFAKTSIGINKLFEFPKGTYMHTDHLLFYYLQVDKMHFSCRMSHPNRHSKSLFYSSLSPTVRTE